MAAQPDNPHDRFFKETFSQPEILIDFLNVFAPEDVRQRLDYATLTREVDTFTDEQLAEHFADLVFSVQYGGQVIRLVLLLEHKSYTEEHPHFQINRYLLNLWESQLKQKQPLTPILPVIVYHGNRRWKRRTVPDYFSPIDQTLLAYLPTFEYLLIDLSTLSDERLPTLRSDYARLTAILLQNSRRKRQLTRLLDTFADVVRRLIETPAGERFVGTGFLYLSYTADLTKVELFGIFNRISSKTESSTMTVAEELIQEGREQGRQQAMTVAEELIREGRELERRQVMAATEELIREGRELERRQVMAATEELIREGRELERRQSTIKFIKAMLNLNLDAATIASAAELPLAEVNIIIDEINRTHTP
ncbi:Rpn family recombination-promoting nuclease/putative transposase [Spirosoma aerophilum]